jgi:hypothetical protein
MAFHNMRAYFTGFNYEPDPDPRQQAEPDAVPIGLQSIVETIVRDKVNQEPEEQLSTAEGDTTFADLIERHEEEAVAGPEPMPSVLDAVPVDAPGGSTDLPAERIVENAPEPALGPPPDDGTAPGEPGIEEGATDMADTTDARDRLGLDSLFGPQQQEGPQGPDMGSQQDDGMFGQPPQGGMLDGPGYDQIVEQAIGYGGEEAGEPQDEGYEADEGPVPEDEGEALEGVEDLLPEEDEILGEPAAPAGGDRGFLKSILHAPERRAAIEPEAETQITQGRWYVHGKTSIYAPGGILVADTFPLRGARFGLSESEAEANAAYIVTCANARKLPDDLASFTSLPKSNACRLAAAIARGETAAARRLAGVTINIGIDGEDEDIAVGLKGGPEGTDFDFEAEASAAARRVLASDVTINIDISGGPDEPDLDGHEPDLDGLEDLPEAEPWAPEPEDEPEEEFGGAPMSDEEAIEGLEAEPEAIEGLKAKPEKGQSKQDEMEGFDELDDLGDVFKPGGESGGSGERGGESGETKQLGV